MNKVEVNAIYPAVDPVVINILKEVREIYPFNCYVGGSFARHVCLGNSYEYNDIDIFILGQRSHGSDITEYLLKHVFDSVEFYDAEEYLIDNQYYRYVCKRDGLVFDFIYVNCNFTELVDMYTAATYSKFYYALDYTEGVMSIRNREDLISVLKTLFLDRNCIIDSKICTTQYKQKIEQLCCESGIALTEKAVNVC